MSTLTATAAQRQALLDLQDLDTEIDRAKAALNPVSYTHLTLPTIYSV